MGYTLAKPFSDVARADFVCEHQGLNYYEDDNCIIMYLDSEKIVNGESVDRTQDADYIAEQKKQLIQTAKATRDTKIDSLTNSALIDLLQLKAGEISQAIYDSRTLAKAQMYEQAKHDFYNTTGLTPKTIGV
jgi:hypothetical protein